MSHVVWFRAALPCLRCASTTPASESEIYTSGLGRDPIDTSLRIGDVLEVDLDDFAEGYFTLHQPAAEAPVVVAVEQWGCKRCKTVQWARLELERVDQERYRWRAATTIALTPETLRDVHYVSRKLDSWIEVSPRSEAGPIWELVRHLMPWVHPAGAT